MPLFPYGSILVPSDTSLTGVAAVLSPVDGSLLGTTVLGIFCEMGDILPNGDFALGKKQNTPSRTTDVFTFTADTMAEITSVPMTTIFVTAGHNSYAFAPIRGNGSDRFYVASDLIGNGNVARTARVVFPDGSLGPTTWTLVNSVGNDQVKALAPTYNNGILYYSTNFDGTIYRHNLVTDTDMGVWVASIPNDLAGFDIYVLPDGTVLRTYLPDDTASPTQWQVQHLALDGSILHTYALGADVDAGSFIFMALDWSDPTVFWVRTFPTLDGSTSVFTKYKLSDGTALVTFTVTNVDGGGQVPLSCPFFILPAPAPPPPPPPPGPQGTLVFDMKTLGSGGRWFPDAYTPGVRMRTWEPGAGVHNQVLGHVSGDVTVFQGQSDQGSPIAYAFRVPDVDGGDPRRQKAFGDLIVDADPAGGAGFTVSPAYDDFEVGLPPSTVGAGLSGRQQFILDIQSGLAQIARNLAIQVDGSDTVAPIFYLWEIAFVPKVEDTQMRATDWDDAGYFGAKYVQGVLIEADTFGGPKQLQVESDCGGLTEEFTLTDCTDTIQEQYAYSFAAPFIAHLLRIVPLDAVGWRFYRARFIFEPSPEAVSVWQTQPTTLDLPGYTQEERILIAHMSTSDFDVSVTADGVTMTYRVLNSGGRFVKTEILERPNKGKVYQYRAATIDGSQTLRIFQKDLEVRHRAWGSNEPYQPFRPFGDVSRESGARI